MHRSRHLQIAIVAAAVAAASAPPARAQIDLSAAAHASTLGFGVEASLLLTSHLGVRAMYNFMNYDFTVTNSGITYSPKIAYRNAPLLIDLYPSARGTFHLSGGIVFNQNTVTGPAQPDQSGDFTIDGQTYTAAEVGTLTVTLKYPSSGWYAGFGWGTPAGKSRIGFVCDIGAFFSTPTVSLTSPYSGSVPGLAASLQAQADSTQATLKKYASIYPVISLGFNVRF